MEALRLAGVAVLTALLYALLRQLKPAFAPMVVLAGCVLLVTAALPQLRGLLAELQTYTESVGLNAAEISVLLRVLTICIVTHLAAELCRDNTAAALASALELAGNLCALATAAPLLKSAIAIAMGWMNAL